jgi:uncharacterized lipoprotein YajG
MNILVKADVRAICQSRGKRFSKSFTSRMSRSDISPASFPNENLLNSSLSEIMGEIFSDPALIACLTHNPTNPQARTIPLTN